MEDRFKFRVVYYNDVEKKYFIFEPDLISADGTARAYAYGESGADEYYDTVTLNQCTGLKDKNGKLIYEGDIVNIIYIRPDGLEIRKKCKIEFSYYSFWLYYKCGASLLYQEDCTYEIIGNIYENSDLLEVENEHNGWL